MRGLEGKSTPPPPPCRQLNRKITGKTSPFPRLIGKTEINGRVEHRRKGGSEELRRRGEEGQYRTNRALEWSCRCRNRKASLARWMSPTASGTNIYKGELGRKERRLSTKGRLIRVGTYIKLKRGMNDDKGDTNRNGRNKRASREAKLGFNPCVVNGRTRIHKAGGVNVLSGKT